jgi:acyl-CoA synthetase (AMP-forming)/AMP-acid ligase II
MTLGDTSDLVPAELRSRWVTEGHCPGVDLFTLYERRVTEHPDKVAVIDDAGEVTYAELHNEALGIAAWLRDVGVGPGDVVGLQLPNQHEACACDLAIAAVGAVALPFPILYRTKEARSLLSRAQAKAFLCARRFRDFDHGAMAVELRDELPHLEHVAVLGEPLVGTGSLDPRAGGRRPDVSLSPNEPVRIIVTSGTESEPKMVLYHHDAIGGGVANVLTPMHLEPTSRFLLLPPLSTGFGALGTFAALARHGLTMVVSAAFDPAATFKLVEREHVTHLFAVPSMLAMLVAAGKGGADLPDLSSLQVVASFGSAISEGEVRAVHSTFGCRFVNGYGCTDGAICMTGWDDPPEKIATTVGQPSPGLSDIRILDPDGRDVPTGAEGELCARGPMSPLRYAGSPELDAAYRFGGGWVRTGDLAVLDTDGYLRISGRKKDVIVRGGYNISPAETEAAVARHPSVVLAACVAYPDERLGERMCACVTLADGATAPTLAELQGLCEQAGLARIKQPERLEVLVELPLNPTGKVLKRVLRERLATEGA